MTEADAHDARDFTMYIEECLARDRQAERLRQARNERVVSRVAELTKMQKRQERAERELLYTWRRMEQLRSMLS
jgi:hypothetical protein